MAEEKFSKLEARYEKKIILNVDQKDKDMENVKET